MMLKNRSITFKLIFISAFSSSLALLLFSFTLLYYEITFVKRDLIGNLQMQVEIIAENSLASLAFMDDLTTRKTLSALKHNPNILYAGLYTAQEQLLGDYHIETYQEKIALTAGELATLPRLLETTDYVQIVHPIYIGDDLLGYLFLRSSFSSFEQKLFDFMTILFATFCTTLFIALSLSQQLQRIVSRPIISIADFIQHLTLSKIYDVQITKESNDEFGRLVDAFNEMLRQLNSSFEQRDKAQQALSHHLTHLQEIVNEQTVDLQNALNTADLANRSKSDFLANMSHEIRTPMNAILGMTHLAQRTQLSRKQRDYLNKIESSSQMLLIIINEILDFSKIEAGKLQLENSVFSLDNVLKHISDMLKIKAEQKNIQFNFVIASEVPQNLVGDSLRLGQILLNLMSNAVKFTEFGEVVMRVELINHLENTVELRFCVCDTGIGMSEEQLKNLFQPFSQADTSTTRKYGGSGLGLSICKQLAQLMNGHIQVESVLNSGSIFTFDVALGISPDEYLSQSSSNKGATAVLPYSPSYSTQRVLLVEDNEINQQVAVELLTSMALQVCVANNGEEGVKLALAENFDLILMDVQMPVMDGLTAARLIRAKRANVPIIAMTAHAMLGDREKSLAAGMNDHLTKPVNLDRLIMILNRWLKIDQEMVKPMIKKDLRQSLLPEQLLPFDLKVALTFCGDDSHLLHQLLLNFATRYKNTNSQLQQWIQEKNFIQAEYLSHSIKGVAGTLAAQALRQAASELEMALHNQKIDNVDLLVDELNNALTVAIDAVGLLPPLPADENENLLDTEEFLALLTQFHTALCSNKFNAVELFEQLKQNLNHLGLHQTVSELTTCLNELNFAAALTVLNATNVMTKGK